MNTKVKAGWHIRLTMINWLIKTITPFTKMRITEVRGGVPQIMYSENDVVIQLPDYRSQLNNLENRVKELEAHH